MRCNAPSDTKRQRKRIKCSTPEAQHPLFLCGRVLQQVTADAGVRGKEQKTGENKGREKTEKENEERKRERERESGAATNTAAYRFFKQFLVASGETG